MISFLIFSKKNVIIKKLNNSKNIYTMVVIFGIFESNIINTGYNFFNNYN